LFGGKYRLYNWFMSNKIVEDIIDAINSVDVDERIKKEFIKRVNEGNLTRDENPDSHFCIYFAAIDLIAKKVFIGHHIKSGLWLFNGGHMDKGETPLESTKREISEEWGKNINIPNAYLPVFLTVTKLNNPKTCKYHYDIWNFINVDENNFFPDKECLDTEFYETGWKNIEEARKLVTDINTLLALEKIEKLFLFD
jgi:8-oxo-dGTP pyrophosphatase MutT (NUDIX family)